MNITLYVGNKLVKFFFEIGWFSGNEMQLIGLSLFKCVDKTLFIIDLTILKFNILFGADRLDL